jgi:hypothetical protein
MTLPRTLLLPLLLAASACAEAPLSISGPATTALGTDGIEQVIELQTEHGWKGTRGAFALTSRLVNRGDAPVTLRVTPCYLRPGVDVKATPSMELLAQVIPGCVSGLEVVTLQPGESSSALWFGGIVQRPGRYLVSVRHAADPEMWGTIEVVAR